MTFSISGHVPSPVHGVTLATVLTVSTKHMPETDQDLSPWSWGREPHFGLEWFYAYEEDPSCGNQQIPEWLHKICTVAREKYNGNWVLMDPDGDVLDDFPTYEH